MTKTNINDLYFKTVTEKQMQELIGTNLPLSSDKFWQEKSEDVDYMDGDLETCVETLKDDGIDMKYEQIYYVKDIDRYMVMKPIFNN